MNEATFQRLVVDRLKRDFPGCFVMRNDPRYVQGIPDLLILFRDRWAMLEVKKSQLEDIQPNQTHYVEFFDEMSYASFIYPENEERVFDELQLALDPRR